MQLFRFQNSPGVSCTSSPCSGTQLKHVWCIAYASWETVANCVAWLDHVIVLIHHVQESHYQLSVISVNKACASKSAYRALLWEHISVLRFDMSNWKHQSAARSADLTCGHLCSSSVLFLMQKRSLVRPSPQTCHSPHSSRRSPWYCLWTGLGTPSVHQESRKWSSTCKQCFKFWKIHGWNMEHEFIWLGLWQSTLKNFLGSNLQRSFCSSTFWGIQFQVQAGFCSQQFRKHCNWCASRASWNSLAKYQDDFQPLEQTQLWLHTLVTVALRTHCSSKSEQVSHSFPYLYLCMLLVASTLILL